MSAGSGSSRDKVVIIGAGLSGLAAGCLLAGRGVDVTILEANEKVGGCCATTTIDGFTFHDGAVYLAAPQLVDAAFARLSLDRPALVPLRTIKTTFAAELPDGSVVTIGAGPDVRVDGKGVDAVRLQDELQQLLQRWQPVVDLAVGRLAAEPFSPWRSLRYGWKHLHKLRGTVASELRRLISDERVRAALGGTLLHMGVGPEKMPAASMVGLATILHDGLFLPEGGMGRIPGALAAGFQKRGGRMRCSSPVSAIIVHDGRVSGVEIAGGERIEADAVISTVSPMTTFTSLIDFARLRSSPVRRRLSAARLSHRAVSLQFGVRNHLQPRGLMTMALPALERQGEVVAQDPMTVKWPVYSVPTMVLPELAPSGGSIVEMFVPVRISASLGHWPDDQKPIFANAAARALQHFHDVDIAVTRVRTPVDFRDQMHLYEGALYGLSPTVLPQEQFSSDSPVRGLFLAGQSTYPGYGVGPSMMSGIFAADATLG